MFENVDYSGLTGIVIKPDDPKYDETRQEYNRAIQKYPLAIVYCLKIRDVGNAVRWARKNDVGFRIRTGGHNYEGYSVGNAVLVIDLSRLNAVRLDRFSRTVEVQGGALNRDLNEQLSKAGYTFPVGSCPTVGVSSYALGGGWNFFCRYLGLGCDSLIGLKMVNYEGEILTATESCNPGLYWACRGGGGGNFGVIVSLLFRIPRRCEMVTYFTIYRPGATSGMQEQFLSTWQQWLPGLDRRMTLRPSIYNSIEEGRAIFSRGIFFGRPGEAEKLLRLLIDSADLKLSMRYIPFSTAVAILGSVYPASEMFKSTGRFINEQLYPDEIKDIVSLLDERPEGVELIELGLFALGGRESDVPDTDTAYFYRDALYIMGIQSMWTNPKFQEQGDAWLAMAFNTIEGLSAGSFVNFPYDALVDYEKAYYGGNVPRLRAVKTEYDPEDVFNFPQSISLL